MTLFIIDSFVFHWVIQRQPEEPKRIFNYRNTKVVEYSDVHFSVDFRRRVTIAWRQLSAFFISEILQPTCFLKFPYCKIVLFINW
jgi:hypothetical protein